MHWFFFVGVMCEKGKTFGIYATQVTKLYDTGYLEQWHIYRRYSDFHDMQAKVKDKVKNTEVINYAIFINYLIFSL